MLRFHFRVSDAVHPLHEASCELADVRTARGDAIRFASDVLREVGPGVYADDIRDIVTDDDGDLCWDLKIIGIEGPGAAKHLG